MESGATAWECREMSKRIDRGYLIDFCARETVSGRLVESRDMYREAIMIEALECLAEKKEAARVALPSLTGDGVTGA